MKAFDLAISSKNNGEIPVGVIIVKNETIIASATNCIEKSNNALKHAEIIALEEAQRITKNRFLNGCDLYVTLEPCIMCLGAILLSRIDNLYFSSFDERFGFFSTTQNLNVIKRLNSKFCFYGGLYKYAGETLIKSFFHELRQKKSVKDES